MRTVQLNLIYTDLPFRIMSVEVSKASAFELYMAYNIHTKDLWYNIHTIVLWCNIHTSEPVV